jgi:hypothetical protein
MKNKIFFLVVLLLVSNITLAIGQNKYPAKDTFNFCGTQKMIDASNPEFSNNSYILGWMWDSRATISDALFMNQHDAWCHDPAKNFSQGEKVCVKSTNGTYDLFTSHGGGYGYLCARSMLFKPTLLIIDPLDYYAIANQCKTDTNQNASVFGWKYIHPLADTTDCSLILQKTNSAIYRQVVLQQPWKISELSIADGEYEYI